MDPRMRVHLAAGGLLALIVGIIVLFWSFPKLLVYLLLAMVAALAYGALYLILAARLDPQTAAAAVEVTDRQLPGPTKRKRVLKKAKVKTRKKTKPNGKKRKTSRSRS